MMETQLTLDDIFEGYRRGELPESECTRIGLHLLPAIDGIRPDRKLVESVRRVGVRNPIQLVDPGNPYLPYTIIEGRRRIAAAREAGLNDVPACVYEGLDGALAAVFAIEGNALRSTNPVDELDNIEQLIQLGASEQVIAKATGMAVGTIRKRLHLLKLHPELMAALRDGLLTMSVAEAAAKLPMPYQDHLVEQFIETGKLTMQDVRDVGRARQDASMQSLDDGLFAAPELDMPTGGAANADVEQVVAAARLVVERAALDALPQLLREAVSVLAVALEGW